MGQTARTGHEEAAVVGAPMSQPVAQRHEVPLRDSVVGARVENADDATHGRRLNPPRPWHPNSVPAWIQRLRRAQGEDQTQPYINGSTQTLADPDRQGQPQQERAERQVGGRAEYSDEAQLADTNSPGLEVRIGERGNESSEQPAPVGASEGLPQPRVGRAHDGLRAWLYRGEDPEAWETDKAGHYIPRTVAARTVPNRPARIKALGNGVVPQCACEVGYRLLEIEEREFGQASEHLEETHGQ